MARNRHAALVGIGIFLSRIVGLVRQQVFNYYFGIGDAADAWGAAFKIPNFLQNLFGEGVLSASFIPVYARLLAQNDRREAGRVAGAVGAALALIVSVIVLLGIVATPYFIWMIAGFEGPKLELTIRLVQVLFPGAGLLVLSAWCLGILNSHRKFLLSYTAPVIWSLAMIGVMLALGGKRDMNSLVIDVAWASVAGSGLMFLVQLPTVLRIAPRMSTGLSEHAREVARNFVPVFISRGVVQISGYIDLWLASYLPSGAVSGMLNAQTLYMLPVSLFGMSVSAAELPEMSSALGDSGYLNRRLNAGLRQIAFFIVPSAIGFFALGDVVTGALFEIGRFHGRDSKYVWGILAGSAVGLLAQTLGRLYSSTYYALRDTRTPLRFAIVRVFLTTALGYLFAFPLPRWIGIDPRWGAAGLTASAGIAGWVEFTLLRRSLNERIGVTGVPASLVARLWGAAAMSAAAAWGVKLWIGMGKPVYVHAAVILGVFGLLYFALTYALGVDECRRLLRRAIP